MKLLPSFFIVTPGKIRFILLAAYAHCCALSVKHRAEVGEIEPKSWGSSRLKQVNCSGKIAGID
jgi:hypothetical protein